MAQHNKIEQVDFVATATEDLEKEIELVLTKAKDETESVTLKTLLKGKKNDRPGTADSSKDSK